MTLWMFIVLCLVILLAAQRVYRGLQGLASVIFEGLLRAAFISNFSRFGDFNEYQIAVIDDKRGYFVRDGALWMVDVIDSDGEGYDLVKSTARPVDLMTVDAALLKEAMAAVDTLHGDFDDLREEPEE